MRGARTPEELETLFEDAFVTRDALALAQLFEDGGVLATGDEPREARGGGEITRCAVSMWKRDRTYVADPWRVLRARGTALVIAEHSINVVRRGDDGAWRYAISLLSLIDASVRGTH